MQSDRSRGRRWKSLTQVLRAVKRGGLLLTLRKFFRFAISRISAYKSQKGQDRWVLETLRNKEGGYFVDLAASDGVTFSNTWVLEKKFGWDGIAIEPNPYFFPNLVRSRSCKVLELVVDSEAGVAPFRIDIGGLGGIVADDTANNARLRGDQLEHAEIAQLPAKTLTEVLDEAGAPATMDYLSLDVEGAEERVIRGLDLDRYTFYCMTIEQPNEEVNRLLLDHGYRFVKNEMCDTFYVHESHPFFEMIERHPFEAFQRKS